ncbi:MAG TPA: platelet-activating factor acetylhydrolase IB subunit [Planctomycetota bacterium]
MKTLLLALLILQAKENAWEPAPRVREYAWMSTASWKARHEAFLKRAKEGKCDLLFLGDSITEGWGNNAVWKKAYAPRNAVNFGIGGDTTQNVLWRIQNGELEGLAPKAVVLMIGTNNFGLHGDAPADVAKGVAAVVKTLREKLPASKLLLLGVFPRDEKPNTGGRKKILELNAVLARIEGARFLDIGPKFLAADGTLTKDVAPDFLHLSEKGYQIWADAMAPTLDALLN